MTREDALKQFEQEQREVLEEYRDNFNALFSEKAPLLIARIKEAFSAVGKQAKKRGKEKIVYFHFSLLRCDLINRKYQIFLQAQDIRWFLDPEPVETCFSVDFLFSGLSGLWDRLLEAQKKYIGKVNSYDASFIALEEAMRWNRSVGNALRYFLRDVEDSPEFAGVPKEQIWDIRWGEYRGPSVLCARVNRTPKTEADWREAVLKDETGDGLSESCWYQAKLKNEDLRGRRLLFATFEECELEEMNFAGADLTGSRFKNCVLRDCNFDSAVLSTVFFENCRWRNSVFQGAVMEKTVFTEKEIPLELLDEGQAASILVRREEER